MKYNVYIQDVLTTSIEANDTDDALRLVAAKIKNGEILFDETKPTSIRLEHEKNA